MNTVKQAYHVCHFGRSEIATIAVNCFVSHLVSLSGGLASARAAELVIERQGRDAVGLMFMDTLYEDEDLYRFLADLMARWGGLLYWYTDGRTPLEVAEQKKLIPCNMAAPCSYELKVKPFRQFLQAMPSLPVVYIGLDHWEKKRLQSVKASYAAALPDVVVEYPLLWQIETRSLVEVCRQDWHIEPPRLYTLNFKHNNCGGRCVRQGSAEWRRLARHFPERYAACEAWEQEQRDLGGARARRSFASRMSNGVKLPYTLTEIRTDEANRALELFSDGLEVAQ
jgi:hypothetical protein